MYALNVFVRPLGLLLLGAGLLLGASLFRSPALAQRAPGVEAPVLQRDTRPGGPAPNQPYTPAGARLDGFSQRRDLQAASLVANVEFRSVGPTVMSGRVVDVDVSTGDPTHFYVAYASGGLWKTTSNGTSFEPLFDDQATMTIGDIAVDWARGETIWVGAGENNSSRSSYAGTGIYKSTDGGATWEHLGLEETHHIGRILVHPDDPETVWVASIGHLYSSNPERGVYKTTDGGATWDHTLFIDDSTGVIDLVLDPSDPNVLYAAAWHRSRRAWNFVESGASSGVYKSTDGGLNWTLLTGPGSGFPTGDHVGRIGLDIFPGDPGIVYALLDNQDRRPEEDEDPVAGLTRDALPAMSRSEFLDVSEEDLTAYLADNDFPEEYTAEVVREKVRNEEIEPVALVEFLEDANRELFDTPVVGAEVYRSDDGGATWRKMNEDYIEALYNAYGYYFGEIRVSPHDPDRIYVLGVPILRSDDAGRTFININEENVHVDHHALWVNPNRPGHLVDGNDGGVNISYDDGETWFKINTPSVGQFYAVGYDMAEPYRIYGGLQDNGVWMGPSTYEGGTEWQSTGDYPFDELMGGDGMQVQVDTRTNDLVYTGFQFGNYFRINQATGDRERVRPQHDLGERPFRFNWQTPIHLSRHNQDILYIGSNKVHRSLDRGDTFETLSDDLTRGGRPGDVPYGTLTTLDESALQFGLLYAGSDDGYVHVTWDGGVTWTRISDAFPAEFWVSHVDASDHEKGTVYVTLNGYRWDNFEPHLYRSSDFGQTWERLGEHLPMEALNVVHEDPENPDVLYVGSDHGLYVSLDGGATFMAMANQLPAAPVHDLLVHPRENELIVGTHGRSIYLADVEHVQQLTGEVLAKALHTFPVEKVRHSERWGEKSWAWGDLVEPDVAVPYVLGEAGDVRLQVATSGGHVLYEWTDEGERGLNYARYDLSVDPGQAEAYEKAMEKAKEGDGTSSEDPDAMPPVASEPAEDSGKRYLLPGTYTLSITAGGETLEEPLVVKE